MKISYNWLKQYLDIKLSPESLAKLLTDCGLEVEGLEKWQSVKGGLKGLVIGEVNSCTKHPDADKLSVTRVDIGQGVVLPIVCGAPNVAARQKVVVATVGTILYSGEEPFEIKKAKIRGEVSEGMICAEDEIGLGTSHAGIMVLDPSAKVGITAAEYFNIEEDFVFEIGLTPNRTDAMSHLGVARDIKAVLENADFISGTPVVRTLQIPSTDAFKPENNLLDIPVTVLNPEACPRYTGLTITGVSVKESPGWLKNRLSAIGLKPINNIVDITNFVLHETGQPLHAFDAAEILGNQVIVKKMEAGTRFVTLDEIERELAADDLMICNSQEGMCIGGVFGGLKSGVTEKTNAIFLESACFDPVHIRKTSRHHDLQTDASFRFERGVDPDMTLYALMRAAMLIQEIAGGTVSSPIRDVYPNPFERKKVNIAWHNIDRLVGKSIGKEAIKNILQSLEFELKQESSSGLELNVPFFRVDVTREADVIEEILRIYGYNNIEIPQEQTSSIARYQKPDPERTRNMACDFLSSNGFTEIMNNSLTRSGYFDHGNGFDPELNVKIVNPLSRDLDVMRQSLLFGGLETIVYNQNRKNFDLKLYEPGTVYKRIPNPPHDAGVKQKYNETQHLAIFLTGQKERENWYNERSETDFFYLKSIVFNLLKRLGIESENLSNSAAQKIYFTEGLVFSAAGIDILEIGQLSDRLLGSFDIKSKVFFADIHWDHLFELLKGKKIGFKELPKFPEVRRDLALLIDKKIPFSDIERIAFETEKNLLKKVNLFDVYEGEKIGADKKSYAVSFILQDEEKTLQDKTIEKAMARLMQAYQEKLDATIR
jgi:phenylalanyl-tRNA synthetase beta chain